jgi:dipeptidase
MKCHKVVATLTLAFVAGVGLAQAQTAAAPASTDAATDKAIEQLRKDTRAEVADIISGSMGFTASEAAAFWPLYKSYEQTQKAAGDEKVALVKDYAAHYDAMTDAKATDLVARLQAIEDKTVAAKHQFIKSLSGVLPPKKIARFFQVQNRIQLLVDLNLASSIPLVE